MFAASNPMEWDPTLQIVAGLSLLALLACAISLILSLLRKKPKLEAPKK